MGERVFERTGFVVERVCVRTSLWENGFCGRRTLSEKEFVGERICRRERTSLCENEYVENEFIDGIVWRRTNL